MPPTGSLAGTAPRPPGGPVPGAPPDPAYRFTGHQTFPFRHGWFPKAAAAIHEDPALFARPDALARLGVGKNMVASIRHWCAVAGLIHLGAGRQRRGTPRDRGHEARLTDLGTLLLGAGPDLPDLHPPPATPPPPPPPPPEITGTPLSPVAERR